jgi:hypothetical protein
MYKWGPRSLCSGNMEFSRLLLDAGDGSLRREFLELQRVMAGDNEVNGACQLNHARFATNQM